MESTRVDFPWAGLGVSVEQGMTVPEMLKKAGLDWEIDKKPLYYDSSGSKVQWKPNFALVNSSTAAPIGICGPDYQPVQNAKAFEFFDKFVERGDMVMEAIGSFKGVRGLHVWALASLNNEFMLPGHDQVRAYVLLSHPHIWGQTLQIKPTAMRIYCYNSLMAALRDDECFKHSHGVAFTSRAIEKAQSVVAATIRYMGEVKEKAEFLASKSAELGQLTQYVAELFKPGIKSTIDQVRSLMGKDALIEPHQLGLNGRKVWDSIFQSPGSRSKAAQGTWWGALNGVTHAIDHTLGKDRGTALADAWVGGRATKKMEALDLALKYASKS